MSKRILVVEDQPDNRQIIRDMLAPTDYEITEAENGEEALAAIAKHRPDLILMDIQLPIMDGDAATRGGQSAAFQSYAPTPWMSRKRQSVSPPFAIKCGVPGSILSLLPAERLLAVTSRPRVETERIPSSTK
jgi:PleD family two-component response regulator